MRISQNLVMADSKFVSLKLHMKSTYDKNIQHIIIVKIAGVKIIHP